jgi:hypothetical protein
MTIKTFKSFFAENDAKDYIAPKDSDDEVKDIKPRSKGEVDFKDSHKMTHTKHPVAGDHQFDGSIKGVNEEVELEEGNAWNDMQAVAKSKKSGRVKFDNGKQENVDADTAKQIVTVLNKLNPNNKKKAIETLSKDPAGLMKVLDIVHKA